MEIEREKEIKLLEEGLRNNPVVALLGPRQSGKTTLARQFYAKQASSKLHFFDCEDHRDIAKLTNPMMALEPCIRKLWIRGGFPRSFLARSEKFSVKWREDFIQTFLERDVPGLGLKHTGQDAVPLSWADIQCFRDWEKSQYC